MKEIRKRFYENGSLEEESEYEGNRLHGTVKRYFPNGQLKEVMTYLRGVAEGPCRWYYQNGKLKREMNYVSGELSGEMKAYYESGVLKETWEFEKGEIVGCGATYHDTGSKKQEVQFEQGVVKSVTDYASKSNHMQVVLFSKDGCHLCERVLIAIQNVRKQIDFDLKIIDIAQDQVLFERYGNDIPVVTLNGKEIDRRELSEARLLKLFLNQ